MTSNGDARAAVIELRQYTLRPGRRDDLIRLFEERLGEPQEDAGMAVLGQFRDLDEPDRFVWLRGFPNMPRRTESLHAFYDGPVWREHRDAANATIEDSDDVLLLRPVGTAFALEEARLRSADAGAAGRGFVAIVIAHAASPVGEAAFGTQLAAIRPAVRAAGGALLAGLVSEYAANGFPRLPVREGEHVAVWIAACADEKTLDVVAAIDPASEIRRLQPTARSALQGRA
jgi:hypothetical protein